MLIFRLGFILLSFILLGLFYIFFEIVWSVVNFVQDLPRKCVFKFDNFHNKVNLIIQSKKLKTEILLNNEFTDARKPRKFCSELLYTRNTF